MKITWFGTAAVRLESNEGRILFDPYIRNYGESEYKLLKLFAREKCIMITHGHFDHISHLKKIYNNRQDIDIYCTKTPMESLEKDGIEAKVFHLISPGEQFQKNGFHISVYQGKHVKYDWKIILKTVFSYKIIMYSNRILQLCKDNKRYLENNEILMYELEKDNKRVQILGSAGLQEDITYNQDADLLILAYQGRSDICRCAQNIIGRLKPKAVMPVHFDDAFPPISSMVDMNKFEIMMKKYYPEIKIMIPQLDVAYEI